MLKTLELPKVEYITTPEGKPKSVVISIADWKRISETLSIVSNNDLMQSIKLAKQQLRAGVKMLTLNEVLENL